MDYLRLTPLGHSLVVAKVSEDEEAHELFRLTIDSPEDMVAEVTRLVQWAITQMQAGVEAPLLPGLVIQHE